MIHRSISTWPLVRRTAIRTGAPIPNPEFRVTCLKIGDKVYEQKLVPVANAATIAAIDSGFARKYEYEEEETDEEMIVGYWRVVERD